MRRAVFTMIALCVAAPALAASPPPQGEGQGGGAVTKNPPIKPPTQPPPSGGRSKPAPVLTDNEGKPLAPPAEYTKTDLGWVRTNTLRPSDAMKTRVIAVQKVDGGITKTVNTPAGEIQTWTATPAPKKP